MFQDFNGILSVQLELSNDSKNFKKFREIKREDLNSTVFVDSIMDLLRELINEGKSICKKANGKSFRLRICTEKENYFLYDASLKRIENDTTKPIQAKVPEQEKQRFNLLTKREKEILCFLFRGYKQNDMAYIFGTTIQKIKKHRFSIYDKAGFRNKTELSDWCEKYLLDVFEHS